MQDEDKSPSSAHLGSSRKKPKANLKKKKKGKVGGGAGDGKTGKGKKKKKKQTKVKKEEQLKKKKVAASARARERDAVQKRLDAVAVLNDGFDLGFDLSTLPRGDEDIAGASNTTSPSTTGITEIREVVEVVDVIKHPTSVVDNSFMRPATKIERATGPASDVKLTFAVPVAMLNHPTK